MSAPGGGVSPGAVRWARRSEVLRLCRGDCPDEPACLRPFNLYDFQLVPGNRSLIVIDRGRQRYRLNFIGICYNLQYHLGLGFKTHGVGQLSCVAKGDSVIVRDVVTPAPCIIKEVQYQTVALDKTDAEAAAAAKEKEH